jgi:hypothetical protein
MGFDAARDAASNPRSIATMIAFFFDLFLSPVYVSSQEFTHD